MTIDNSFITKDVADMISTDATMGALITLLDINTDKGAEDAAAMVANSHTASGTMVANSHTASGTMVANSHTASGNMDAAVTTGINLKTTNSTMIKDMAFITKDVADMISPDVTMGALVTLPGISTNKGIDDTAAVAVNSHIVIGC
jgi:hypothetical protein